MPGAAPHGPLCGRRRQVVNCLGKHVADGGRRLIHPKQGCKRGRQIDRLNLAMIDSGRERAP